jgi:hypothetical protein
VASHGFDVSWLCLSLTYIVSEVMEQVPQTFILSKRKLSPKMYYNKKNEEKLNVMTSTTIARVLTRKCTARSPSVR